MAMDAPAQPETRLEHCPHCGSKLPDIPVSLCPYCASPLETAADRKRLESINAGRIERVRGHAQFEEATSWTPPESPRWHAGVRRSWWSLPTTLTGAGILLLLVVPPIGRGFDVQGVFLSLIGIGLIGFGIYLRVSGTRMQAEAVALPLLKRPGVIVDRRSETRIRGWDGDTTYYFKVEFEEGVVGEFRYPGLGAQEEPYATNLPGVAYTRGTDLLHFRHVRV
ncbi:MAG: hypothetical protein AAF627_22155 [Myxococcota bacterium]